MALGVGNDADAGRDDGFVEKLDFLGARAALRIIAADPDVERFHDVLHETAAADIVPVARFHEEEAKGADGVKEEWRFVGEIAELTMENMAEFFGVDFRAGIVEETVGDFAFDAEIGNDTQFPAFFIAEKEMPERNGRHGVGSVEPGVLLDEFVHLLRVADPIVGGGLAVVLVIFLKDLGDDRLFPMFRGVFAEYFLGKLAFGVIVAAGEPF